MSDFEEETYSTIFATLKHPIRRKILRLLSDGPRSFTEIQKLFKMDSPYLTYHLESLKNLVSKTDDGRYQLSSMGEGAIAVMQRMEETPETLPRDPLSSRLDMRVEPLGVTIVAVIFLFVGFFEMMLGLAQMTFDLVLGSLLIGWGILAMLTSMGLAWRKRWAWYLAFGQTVTGFLRIFAVPYAAPVMPFRIAQLPLELILLSYLFMYLFFRRDVFLGKTTVGTKTWLKINKIFIVAIIVWVTMFTALKPFAMEDLTATIYTSLGNPNIKHGPIRVLVRVSNESDLDPYQDYYSVNIQVISEKPMDLLRLTVKSEQGICDNWHPTQGSTQMAVVDVTGEGTDQIEWAMSPFIPSNFKFEAEYVVSEGDNFNWNVEADVQRLTSIWWIGLEVGAMSIILAWSAIRYTSTHKPED